MSYLSVAVFDFFKTDPVKPDMSAFKGHPLGRWWRWRFETSRVKHDSPGTTGFDRVLLWQDETEEAGREGAGV